MNVALVRGQAGLNAVPLRILGRVNTVDNLYNLLNKYLVLPHFTTIPPDGWRIGKLDLRREHSGELNLHSPTVELKL